jgi:hypothetical protein
LIIAGIIRAAVLWAGWEQLDSDPDAYDAIAQTMARTGTFGLTAPDGSASPTAFRPPLYPAILAIPHAAIIAASGQIGPPPSAENAFASRLAIAAIHGCMGLMTVVLTYLTALRLLGPSVPRSAAKTLPSAAGGDIGIADGATTLASMIAAAWVILDPILLQASVLVMTETLATTLAIAATLQWVTLVDRVDPTTRPPAGSPNPTLPRGTIAGTLRLGMLLGLAYLCRPTFIVWTFLLVVYLILWSLGLYRQERRLVHPQSTRRWKPPAAVAIGLSLTSGLFLVAWTVRNNAQFGKPIWATTHGGYTLLLGNNPSFFDYMRSGTIGIAWDPEDFFARWRSRHLSDPRNADFWTRPLPITSDPQWTQPVDGSGFKRFAGEVGDDRLAYETAKMAIGNDRGGFALASLWRLGRLVSPMPQSPPQSPGPPPNRHRIGVAAVTLFYSLSYLFVLVGAWRLRRHLLTPRWAAAIALFLSLAAVHTFYWTNMRMRAPAIPVVAILASAALLRRSPCQPIGPRITTVATPTEAAEP